jgi:MoxR-like ATPase
VTNARIETAGENAAAVLQRVGSVVIGKTDSLRLVLAGILAGGHVLLEDFPGLGKTLAARSFAQALGIEFTRAQFTPDLLPADLTGSFIYNQRLGDFEFREGPLFTGLLLADEINRTPPTTQAALLEAMQERQITVEGRTFELPPPFHVLATANPVEYEGTYPLPEAQLDRFFYKLKVGFPGREALHVIMDRTTHNETPQPQKVLSRARVLEMRELARRVPLAKPVQDYAIRVLQATHPETTEATPMVKKYVRYGSSPRGAQAILLGAKIRALLDGRFAVSVDDIRKVAAPALRHRTMLNFEGEAEGIGTDALVADILEKTAENKA